MNEDEIFYPLRGYEGLYEINKKSDIRSVERYVLAKNGTKMFFPSKILIPVLNSRGYYVRTLYRNNSKIQITIHRLVALNFIPNPNNLPVINHKNGIKTDNRIENLEWVTIQYNTQHAYTELGRIVSNRKLNKNEVIDIFYNTSYNNSTVYRDGKFTVTEMSRKYSVSEGVILNIIRKRNYLEITKDLVDVPILRKQKMSLDERNLRRRERRLELKQQYLIK